MKRRVELLVNCCFALMLVCSTIVVIIGTGACILASLNYFFPGFAP